MNPLLTKSYTAGAAISPCRLLKAHTSDGVVIQATDGSAAYFGVSAENLSVASGDMVDAIKSGIAWVELGDTVARGDKIKADAVGRGVTVTIAAGTTVHVAGTAQVSGVVGDIIPVMLEPTVINNDTGIVTADITITTGQLLALNAAPKTLVAAPGVGYAVLLVDAQLFLDYNSAAYDGIAAGEDLGIRYTDGSGQLVATIETTGFLDATADAYRHSLPATTAAITPVGNAALVMCLASGEVATGNSPLKVRVRYRTVALAF